MRIDSHRLKVGEPPGTMSYRGVRRTEPVTLSLIRYDESMLDEREISDVAECVGLSAPGVVNWVNVSGVHNTELVGQLGQQFGLHALVCEDIVQIGQRPKVEVHGDYLYLVVKMLHYHESPRRIEVEQASIIVGRDFVLTFQEHPGDVFDPVRTRIRNGGGRLRNRGPDYLAYALLDAIVDHYFVVLEAVGEHLEKLEHEVGEGSSEGELNEIHVLKRELIVMRKPIVPLREIVATLSRDGGGLIAESTLIFLRDVHDHVMQVSDAIDSYREMISSLQDLHMSHVSNRMNEVMKVLTVISTIFVPMTFVAGIYGMNFEHMPELASPIGYPLFWVVAAGIASTMLVFFRRRKWL